LRNTVFVYNINTFILLFSFIIRSWFATYWNHPQIKNDSIHPISLYLFFYKIKIYLLSFLIVSVSFITSLNHNINLFLNFQKKIYNFQYEQLNSINIKIFLIYIENYLLSFLIVPLSFIDLLYYNIN
jgi:hypothetical protein